LKQANLATLKSTVLFSHFSFKKNGPTPVQEVVILIVGIIGGIGNGISQPLLCIVFGDLIDSMGSLAKIWERLSGAGGKHTFKGF